MGLAKALYFRIKKELYFFGCVRPDLAALNLICDWLELWVQRGAVVLGQKRSEVRGQLLWNINLRLTTQKPIRSCDSSNL